MKIRDLTDWMIMPQTIGPQGLVHLPGQGPNNRFDFKNKGNNRANEQEDQKINYKPTINTDEEWKEAGYIDPKTKQPRYPQLAKLGPAGFAALVNRGRNTKITRPENIKNTTATSVQQAKREFPNLRPSARANFKSQIQQGAVERPIVVRFGPGDTNDVLIGGNTRFTGLMAMGIQPEVKFIDLSNQQEALEAKFQSALNTEPVQPKREWTAFEMACMEGGHPLPEDNSDEAWELLGQKDPTIKKYVTDLGLKYDQDSVNKVVPMIDKARETTITPSQIPQLKNLANKPADPQALKNILKIKGTPDAPEKFAQIMQARDRAEGRSRNYNVADLVNAINTNNYDPPVILKIGTQNFVVGGRTRLYAALALNKPIKIKVLENTVNEKCWDGYKQVGMKNKGGRQVPNCVPEDAAGVGIITKQNTTKDVKPGDEYKNVKKLQLEFNDFIENFDDGKNPGRKGLSKRVGIPKKATLSQLSKIAKNSTGERRRMAQWQLNMRRGRKKAK